MAKLNSKYDVVIIGAGPVGIYISIKLAQNGFHVLVVEEDAQVGKPRFCTGLISKEAFDKFELPRESIENNFSSACFFSPLGSRIRFTAKKIQVYVTDRTKFDQGLYRLAKEKGVEFLLDCRCRLLKINDDCVEEKITLDNEEITVKSDIAILTTGIKYNLHYCVGLTGPTNFLDCSQTQVTGEGGNEVEIFVGNSIAPNSFAWLVPLKENKVRIGISTYKNSTLFLKSLLSNLELKGRIKQEDFDIIRRPIPLGVINRTYGQRTLVVGDAAGQVKPTTGGGIYFGLLCADLAVQTIIDAFRKNNFSADFLRRYEISWKKKIEFDLTMGLYLRKLLADFNDEQIEKLVQFCAQESMQELIEKYADFNHHGRFIKELIKMPAFWKTFYQILSMKYSHHETRYR